MFKNALVLCFSFFAVTIVAHDGFGAEKNDVNDMDVVVKGETRGKFDEDYFIALKAYEDGFYDVAKLNLEKFLKKDTKSPQAGFATYILYQIHMTEKNYVAAKTQFDKLKTFKDDRFDKSKMSNDEVVIATNLDCKEAKKIILAEASDVKMKAYIASKCEVSRDVVDYVAAMPFASDTLILVIEKVKDDKERMLSVYNNLSTEKRTSKILNFYGHYFSSNKMWTDFWRLYSEYKDPDMVNIALDDVWNTGDFTRYVDFFDKNAQKYKLNNTSYCRLIEASNKSGKIFDCQVVDGCLGTKNPQYKKTKLACFMKNEDKQGIAGFMKTVTINEATELCEYGNYIVAKNLYSTEYLGKFSACGDKGGMYEALVQNKDYNAVFQLGNKKADQTDLAYLAIASYFTGKKDDGDTYFKSLTDQNLINMVRSRIGGI